MLLSVFLLLTRVVAATPAAPTTTPPPPPSSTTATGGDQVLNVTLVPVPPAAIPKAPVEPAHPAASQPGPPVWWTLPFAGAIALLAFLALRWWSRRPRPCEICGGSLSRLDRIAAFAELNPAERTEQLVGDVRYEVSLCTACGAVSKRATARSMPSRLAAPTGSAMHRRERSRGGLSLFTESVPPTEGEQPPPPSSKPPLVSRCETARGTRRARQGFISLQSVSSLLLINGLCPDSQPLSTLHL